MFKRILLLLVVGLVVLVASQIRPDIPLDTLKTTYAPPPSQFMALDGMEVHYRDEGQGPALVLLHGTAASLHTWEGWTTALQDSFRVIRLDLPAFGLTGPNATHDYHIDTYVAFLHRFLERLGVERMHLAGNSLGGHIAWRYALAYPEAIDKLILVDPAGYPSDEPPPLVFTLGQTPILNQLLTLTSPRSLLKKSLLDVYADDTRVTPELIDRYQDLSRRPGNRAAFVARTQMVEENRFEDIRHIQAPTLLLWGEQDFWTPFADAKHYEAALPNATLISYPDAGHVPMEEYPERTAADVRRFLLETDGEE